MLVLRRRIGESVRIGEAVVTLIKTEGKAATIGIEADRSIDIKRVELEHDAPAAGTAVNGRDTES